jgi:hypothetical protein
LDHRELDGFARLKLTGPEVHVYLALRRFDHVNRCGESKGLVWPSIATLAARTGKGRTQVKKALRGLEKKGVIERQTAHWHGRSNQWTIRYAWLYGEEAAPPGEGGPVATPAGRDPDQQVVGDPTGRGSGSRPPKESEKESEKDSHPPTPGVASARAPRRAGSDPGTAASSPAPQGVQGASAPGKEEEEEVFAAWQNAGHPEPLARPVREELAALTATHGSSQVVSAIADSACSSKTTPGRAYLPHVRKLLSPQEPSPVEAAWQFCPHCGQGYQEGRGHEERCPGFT